jgi:transposase InsO family protein
MKTIADTLGVARSNLLVQARREPGAPLAPGTRSDRSRGCERRDGRQSADAELLAEIRPHIDARTTYGYRRASGMVNRQRLSDGRPAVNHKRMYRVMKEAGLLLARHTGKPTQTHDGRIITLKSNLRWCSDGFEIRCWNGERVQVAFSLDCCDREAMAYVATTGAITGELVRDLMAESIEHRFGAEARRTPHRIEWLSDNAPCYTAHETREFGEAAGLAICTTPAYSPESNGMAECFVKGFKRDYVYVNCLESAASVMQQLAVWFEDYNEVRPHQALKWKSPREYRIQTSTG